MSNSVRVTHEDWIKERRKRSADQQCLMARMVEQIGALDKMRPESPTSILKKGQAIEVSGDADWKKTDGCRPGEEHD